MFCVFTLLISNFDEKMLAIRLVYVYLFMFTFFFMLTDLRFAHN